MAAFGDGVTQYLVTAGTIAPMASNYSYSQWIKPVASPSTAKVSATLGIYNLAGAAPGGYEVDFVWDHTVSIETAAGLHRQANGIYVPVQLIPPPAAGVWSHICMTYDGSNLRMYLNGV